ncbi:type II toxin-antitoxin system RelE family toxin [Streptobacillus canis]
MMYKVRFTENFEKELKKLDKSTLRVIKNWIIKNLIAVENPRQKGKALTGNLKGVWRYRVGDYRLFARIEDDILIVFLFDVGHRKNIYK